MKTKFLIFAGSALALLGGVAIAQNATPAPTPAPIHRDRNADQTRQQVIDRVQQRFDRLDLNHDGRFTPDEARQARARMRQHRQDRTFDRLDLDHDGSITRDEMNQAHARMRQRMQERRTERGRGHRGHGAHRGGMGRHSMGMRGDHRQGMFGAQGSITLEQMRDRALQRFDRVDLDHDGIVTGAERQEARTRMRAQFRQRMEQRRQARDDAAPSQPQ